MTTTWIKNPLAIYTGNEIDARAGVVIRGTKIVELVAQNTQPTTQIDEIIDAQNLVLTPGLINTHHHLYQTLTRAYPPALNKKLFPWLINLYQVWANLTEAQLFSATQLGISELLLSGCTTIADHHYLFPKQLTNAIDVQIAAAESLGARVVFTRGSMSLGKDDGGLPPQSTVQSDNAILTDSERLISAYHDPSAGAMIQIALAPCSPFSVTKELMIQTAALAEQYQVQLHTHLAETEDENKFCLDRFGMRPVDYLESVNWLQERTWLAHGIHFNDHEIKRLGQAKVGVCHCPTSNMILASGIARTKELEQAGVKVGLGVDGSASNDGSNMLQEIRQALLINRLRYQADQVSHLDALRWATQGSANVLGRSDIGEIAVGMEADLALFALDELRFSGAHDLLAALVLCGGHKAEHVMVAGQWRVWQGELMGQDLRQLQINHQRLAKQLVASL